MTLDKAQIGSSYILDKIDLKIEIKRHLEAMGMIADTKIEILKKKKNGSLIFKVRGTRLAIGKNISKNIYLKENISHE